MKHVYLAIITLMWSMAFTHAQNCGEIIDDTFDVDGALPSGWTEYNTSGRVTVMEGELVFDYTSARASAYRSFTAKQGEMNFSFKMKSQRNWIKAKMNLTSASGELLTGLFFGSDGNKNILFATSMDASGNPASYEGTLDSPFRSNTEYTILLTIDTDSRTYDLYIDGVLKAASVSFLENATDIARIDIQQISMYSGSGKIYFDNIRLTKDDVIRVKLESAISDAQSHLDNVTVGSGAGNYSQDVVDRFQTKIDAASAVFVDCEASQDEVDQAVIDLENARHIFDDARNWGMQSISITVDPGTILCDKNPIWFGGNNTYNASGQGLWDSQNERCHYNVIDLASYTGAQGYRFPGGTMANLYKWKRAIGPVDGRVDNMNSHGSAGPLSNEFGPDEFGQMLMKTPLNKGVIVVAFNWDTPEDAADYVEYMNAEVGVNPNGGIDWAQVRADNGHYEPYGVKYWEIGNELSGYWELSVCNYPNSGDANRGGDAILNGLVNVYVKGTPRTFTNQRAAKESSWVQADCVVDGTASQEFYTKFCPVDLSKTFKLTINGVQWSRVGSFTNSDSGDLHYTIDAESGKIIFGDGVNGSRPSGGHNIILNYSTDQLAGFPDYYTAMKAVDPDIEVISCWEEEEFYREMAALNSPFDGVTKHYYPNATPDAGDEYKMVMKKAVSYKNKIQAHLNYLSKYNNTSLSGKKIKQHLTEFFGGKRIDVVTQHCIMWYDVINSHPDDVGNIMVHSYFKNDNTPMVNTGGNFVSAKGLPYHIFTHLHQDKFVKTSNQGGTYSYNSTMIKNSYPTASINKNGNLLTLVVPNTRDKDELKALINVTYDSFASGNVIGKKWVAKAFDIYQENSAGSPKNVRIEGPFDFDIGTTFTDTVQPFSVSIYQWIVEDREFLSDLDEALEGSAIKKDEGFTNDGKMVANGLTWDKGIGMEAGTSVTYQLNGQYQSFITEFGLDDGFTGGEVKLMVYLDDVLAYQSGDVNSNSPNIVLNMDVLNVDELRIEVLSTLDSQGQDYVILGDARLIREKLSNNLAPIKSTIQSIKISPNPFNDFLIIDGDVKALKVYDLSGKQVFDAPLRNAKKINLSKLTNGVFIAQLEKANGAIETVKVVKQ
ncbi:MAG: NPCBM/NEW2 domain-containing protein [Bacteroidales bacterium]|nr:NPCBM/NEW2 domain-containing protein [Bacteroidales bacterium]